MVHQLNIQTQLPAQNVVMTYAKNKQQLIDIICKELVSDKSLCSKHTQKYKLVVTGQNDILEVKIGITIERRDLSTTHEEADVIIVQQMLIAAEMNLS